MDRAANSFKKSREIFPVFVLAAAGLVFSLVGFLFTGDLTRMAERNRFEKEANFVFDDIEARISSTTAVLHSVAGLFAASDYVDRREFAAFAAQLAEAPSVQALEWVPRVTLADRPGFEQAAVRDGFPDFSFTERGLGNTRVTAGARPEYFPVYYLEPLAGNEAALGFDLASSATRLAALEAARDSGAPVATARITLVQETGDQFGFLVFQPIYRNGADTTTLAARRASLSGFALGVFRINNLAMPPDRGKLALPSSVDIEIFDNSAPAGSRRLYSRTARPEPADTENTAIHASRDLTVGGRQWRIAATPLPGFAGASLFSWQPWAVLVIGLVFTAAAALFLYHFCNRAILVGQLVEERAAQLRDSEARVRAVIDTAVDAVITIDSKGAMETFNPAAERIFGYPAAECIGRNVNMLMPEPDHGAHDGYLTNYLGTGDAKIIGIGREVTGLRKNGESFPMDLSVSEFAVGGKRMFAGLCRDVTERNRASRELEESREILRALADNVPDFISLKDPAGRFRFVNKRFEEWVCLDRKDIVGKTVHDIYPPAQAVEFDALDRKSIDQRLVISREVDLHYPDGKTRTVISTRFPVISTGGDMLGLGTVNFDITEQKRAREEIASVNKELETFAYSVSHDLRAPLRGIDGFSQALVEEFGDKLEGEATHYLERIRAGAQRMGRMIDDILNLSRVTRREMNRESVDLSELAQAVMERLREIEPDRDVSFEVEPGLTVYADERLLHVLLENIIGNAFKFTTGQSDAKIELGGGLEKGEMVLHVRDNGAGFDQAYADKIFEPFQRLHPSSAFPGTGIGLATVARVVQRHGGRVWADGEVGKGATFFFTISG